MKVDNPEVRIEVAKNATKRSGPGSWEAICGDLEEDDNKLCRQAMVFLARVGNEDLDAGLRKIKEQLGEGYARFIRRYNKAYREVEASLEKHDATVKEAPEEEEEPEFTVVERETIESIKKELLEDPIVATYGKYVAMVKPWSLVKGQLAAEMMGRDARVELVRLKGVKAERVREAAEAKEAIKLTREEIDELKEPGPDMWDIDVEIFYPIALGVATGRLAPIGEAIENFGWIFDGRALPELVAISTLLMIDKYEGNAAKLMTYYSAIVARLGNLQSSPHPRDAAEIARRKMEKLLKIEDIAGDIMRQLSEAVIEEGE